jgi:hypothetical protein
MILSVATNDPTAVESHVQSSYLSIFPDGDRLFVSRVFGLAIECFSGHYSDYQAVDARYHDFEHTLQGTLCMSRLLHAWQSANGQRTEPFLPLPKGEGRGEGERVARPPIWPQSRDQDHNGTPPPLTQRLFQLGILGILLHDTGYLKKRDDLEGTGAKYTTTHVNRSAEFAGQLLGERGFSRADIAAVQSMIRCTGVNTRLSEIPFPGEQEQMVGFALATSDLLGQMAADDYVDKLPILYSEFAEAAHHDGNGGGFVAGFKGVDDLIRRTPAFWSDFVLPKLERDFRGLYRFLNDPYPDGPNEYVRRIEANMDRIRQQLA